MSGRGRESRKKTAPSRLGDYLPDIPSSRGRRGRPSRVVPASREQVMGPVGQQRNPNSISDPSEPTSPHPPSRAPSPSDSPHHSDDEGESGRTGEQTNVAPRPQTTLGGTRSPSR